MQASIGIANTVERSEVHAGHRAPATAAAAPAPDTGPPASLVALLAASAGFAVAALYYSQPILGVLGADLGASASTMGLLPTLTQLGYALGILFLVPLGDRWDRRRVIVAKALLLMMALVGAALAPSTAWLLAASLAIGLCATLAQDIVPAAATLAPGASRGRVVGATMTGLLLGILLSRVVGGVVAEAFGWRVMFAGAALSIAAVALASWLWLPRFAPTTTLGYRALLASLLALWRRYPALRRATAAQALLAVGFSAFWSTLAIMLHEPPFELGSAAAGAFGIAGAAGALAAPLAGRLADRRGPRWVAQSGALIACVSFAAMLLAPLVSPQMQLGLLMAAALGFDLGIQSALIAHQTIVYDLESGARSRLNAVLFVGMFAGMAAGAALGGVALARWGWQAVVALAALTAGGAYALRRWAR
ncbi:MFS transporter [Haliangium ochraceum]|uniref:Major facilitator superfamily MFS_1 n=1 Tax=Haliangium ochraceum (strain DSM 14365 / JCM 11303 / SMP-2) TaxID=502025 RepID=D0LVX8_HALO1|nr:MFS transporter [Haliangium ochraceum]ACY14112.1 major facilitator superfamily MFS_1 [Haliangium ochraceum DSM 14365]